MTKGERSSGLRELEGEGGEGFSIVQTAREGRLTDRQFTLFQYSADALLSLSLWRKASSGRNVSPTATLRSEAQAFLKTLYIYRSFDTCS